MIVDFTWMAYGLTALVWLVVIAGVVMLLAFIVYLIAEIRNSW